jgi:lipid II:glycine glycyltransferase (peptidoglycan interpeptide bridge formation enzyme)
VAAHIKKAEKAGVKVVRGGYEDLSVFYDLYVGTAERDRIIPRTPAYFQWMWKVLRDEDESEWDYPLNKVLHKALDLYMSRR